MNVVPIWGGATPEQREQIADGLDALARSAATIRSTFADMAAAMDRWQGERAGQLALARKRRDWDDQHALAAKGDGDAVLYLLRHPRP